MKSFNTNFLEQLTIPHRLIMVIRNIGEYRGKQELFKKQAPEMLENLRHVAIIQSTESSNRLEGITADIGRIKELVEKKEPPVNRSEGGRWSQSKMKLQRFYRTEKRKFALFLLTLI